MRFIVTSATTEKTAMEKNIEAQNYDLLAEHLTAIKQLIDKRRAEKWPNINFATVTVEQMSQITGRNFNVNLSKSGDA